MLGYLAVSLLLGLAAGHEMYPGQCPDFKAMENFEWDKFASGVWYVTEKFDTKSTCLTYEFKTDEIGFKSVEQKRQIPYTDKLGIDNRYKYTGKLFVPQETVQSRMIVRFPLNVIGSASYVVVDTDYDNHGLVCTCQDVNVIVTNFHRISCSMLQRKPEEDQSLTDKMKAQVAEKYQHDFDKIDHTDCTYEEGEGSVWDIDVDQVIRSVTNADDKLTDIAKDITSSFEGSQDTAETLKERFNESV